MPDRRFRDYLHRAFSTTVPGTARRSWLVEGSIAAEAGDEDDWFSQFAAAVKLLERCVSAIGDGYHLSLWAPTSHQEKQLPRPFGYLLVLLAMLFGVALGVGQSAEEGQVPNPRSPRQLMASSTTHTQR